MRTIRTIREMRTALHPAQERGNRIGLVPTMGAFHDGHIALMRAARLECDVVVVSLFVNPTQFGPEEDFARYPRDESADAQVAHDQTVDFLFAPSADEMYPPGFGISVDPGPVATGLCAASRPGHFEGVATVVARLFGIVRPDVAYFGLKDYQQVAVIRRLVADLAMPIEIRALATMREPDGLAMSSRNRYLGAEARAAAPALFAGLRAAQERYDAGERDEARIIEPAREEIDAAGMTLEYLELRDAETLAPYTPERPAVLAAAVEISGTRLIDNVQLTPPRGVAGAVTADRRSVPR